jgi:hypothetical protein
MLRKAVPPIATLARVNTASAFSEGTLAHETREATVTAKTADRRNALK